MADYSDQKQCSQYKYQQNKNNEKKWNKNNCMDISSDKQVKSHTRKFEHG